MWCLKRPMARKPLMHNYIYFETLEVGPDAEPIDLEQSIQRIQKEYPDFPRDEVEEFLLDWIDMGYDPENYSQAQLDELDSLTERWVADHLRKKKASKKQKRTRHS